ncbi:MAG: AAA family ATPase [Xenococcaceae cyanobacterium]
MTNNEVSRTINQINEIGANPFVVVGPVPPENFVGRKREIAIAFDQILNRSHLAISGDLGMGKSSLLQYLASPKAWHERNGEDELANAVIILLNCAKITPFTPSAFWENILSSLQKKFEGNDLIEYMLKDSLEKNKVESSDLEKVLRQMKRLMEQQFLVLLIDNYDVALNPNKNYTEDEMIVFLSQMRRQTQIENLSTVVTSTQPLHRYDVPPIGGSPFYYNYYFKRLEPLKDNEVNSLFAKMPFELDDKIRTNIREFADGYPVLLQRVLNLLYNTLSNTREPFDLKSFKKECIEQTDFILPHIWEVCTQVQRQYLMCLALSDSGIPASHQYSRRAIDNFLIHKQKIGDELANRGIIKRKTQGDREFYEFKFLLMKRWGLLRIQCGQESDLIQELEDVFFGISRGQLEQLAKVMSALLNEQLMSIVTSMFRFVTSIFR